MTARTGFVVLPASSAPQPPIARFTDVEEAADYARAHEPHLGAWQVRAAHEQLIDWDARPALQVDNDQLVISLIDAATRAGGASAQGRSVRQAFADVEKYREEILRRLEHGTPPF